jgi:hypothetical protein
LSKVHATLDGLGLASAMRRYPPRSMEFRFIVFFVVLQVLGYSLDAVWHGLVHPGLEAGTPREMFAHLATVHLPLYAGVCGFFVAVASMAIRRVRRGSAGAALWTALAGATAQVIGEAWHAWTHLRLAPEAMIPGLLSLVGFMVALAALGFDWRRSRARHGTRSRDRRAA